MNLRITRLLLSVLAVAGLWTSQVQAAAEHVPGEYLVKMKSSGLTSMSTMSTVSSLGNLQIADVNEIAHLVKVRLAPSEEVQALLNLYKNPNVEYVVPNIKLHTFKAPIDLQTLQSQWAIQKVNAEAAWAKAGNKGSKSIVVAVIDTGADYKHESLAPNMVQGYNFKDNNNDPMDMTGAENPGHGTHCSGIIGATGLISNGTIGISPTVSIMPLRFIGEDGSGDLDLAIKAIDYAIAQHVRVISASWGAAVDRATAQPLIDAVKRADDAGIIFVVASANDGKDNDTTDVFPANAGFPNSISVAASDDTDSKPSWSNYGKQTVHLASPGLNILSTLPGNKYDQLSGTSMATPLVSGLVAFILAQDPSLTGVQIRALLQETGAKVNIETACNCRVDALAAVTVVKAKTMFIAPAASTLTVGQTLKFAAVYGQAPLQFTSVNQGVGTIAADGTFTAKGSGTTTVTVRDAKGMTSTSLNIDVVGGAAPSPNPPSPNPPSPHPPSPNPPSPYPPSPGGGGMPTTCPLPDASECQMMCQMMPTLPWCN